MALQSTFKAAVNTIWSVASDMLTDVTLKKISESYNTATQTNTETVSATLTTTAFIEGYNSFEMANLPIQTNDQKMILNGNEVAQANMMPSVESAEIDTSWKVEIDDVDWDIVNVKSDGKRIYWECQIRKP